MAAMRCSRPACFGVCAPDAINFCSMACAAGVAGAAGAAGAGASKAAAAALGNAAAASGGSWSTPVGGGAEAFFINSLENGWRSMPQFNRANKRSGGLKRQKHPSFQGWNMLKKKTTNQLECCILILE